MKGYLFEKDDIKKLKSLVGKEISTFGSCAAQDEHGVVSNSSMAPAEGILKSIEFDEKTGQPHSIIVEDPKYQEGGIEIVVQFSDSKWSWDLHRSIEHNGKEVIKIARE